MSLVGIANRLFGEVRIQLDLIDGGNDVGPVDQVLQVPRLEIGDADGAYAAFGQEFFSHLVGRDSRSKVRGQRPMQQVQVDVIQPKPPQARLERAPRRLIAIIGHPQLRGDEDLASRDAGAPDSFTDLTLVVVRSSRVDKPVATGDRRFNGVSGLRRRRQEDSEPERRHFDAVVQRDEWTGCGHALSLSRLTRLSIQPPIGWLLLLLRTAPLSGGTSVRTTCAAAASCRVRSPSLSPGRPRGRGSSGARRSFSRPAP